MRGKARKTFEKICSTSKTERRMVKIINKILKPFGVYIMKRDTAEEILESHITLLRIRLFVSINWIMFKDTILGDLIDGIGKENE